MNIDNITNKEIDLNKHGKCVLIKIYEERINQLQSNWNSLREWLEERHRWEEYDRVEQDMMDKVLDKMNELESGEKKWKH